MRLDNLFSGSKPKRFEKQIRPHLTTLYQYAYRLCGHPDDAEDLGAEDDPELERLGDADRAPEDLEEEPE